MNTQTKAPQRPSTFTEFSSIIRLHILSVGAIATLTFGWLYTGRYPWAEALLCALDWLLINLLNRISDVREDQTNKIAGASRIADHPQLALYVWLALQAFSLMIGYVLCPELLAVRLCVQIIGVAYSYRIIPTFKGFKRFKDLYFFKNFMSAFLFVLTGFYYPLQKQWAEAVHAGVWVLIVFFVLYEITFEIFYDLRDLDGDTQEKIPTYPVIHGVSMSMKIIDGLLFLSVATLLCGFAFRFLGVRELLFIVAPILQYVYIHYRAYRSIDTPSCVYITNLATAQLVFFLLGSALWLKLGLAPNIYW